MWHGVDPLAGMYPNWSPFAYTLNNPITYVDPTGMSTEEGGGGGEPPVVTITDTRIGKGIEQDNLKPVNSINPTKYKTPKINAYTLSSSQQFWEGMQNGNIFSQMIYGMANGLNTLRQLPFVGRGDPINGLAAWHQYTKGSDEATMAGLDGLLTFAAEAGYIAKAGMKIIGTAQKTSTYGHATLSNIFAWFHALDPRTVRVTLNLGYKRLLGEGDWLFKWGPRPDVGVLYSSGKIRPIEIMSRTDVWTNLRNRHLGFFETFDIPSVKNVNIYNGAKLFDGLLR